MRFKGILITFIVLMSLVFAVTNWQVLVASVPINFIFLSFQLPLGLVLLGASVLLCLIFFFISLIDRASQLSRITQLERQIENLGKKLDKKRLDELASIEKNLDDKVTSLSNQVQNYASQVESMTNSSLAKLESQAEAKFSHLEERVLLVRNELAADIAETEDSLKKRLTKA